MLRNITMKPGKPAVCNTFEPTECGFVDWKRTYRVVFEFYVDVF